MRVAPCGNLLRWFNNPIAQWMWAGPWGPRCHRAKPWLIACGPVCSRATYNSRYKAQEQSARARDAPDKLQWEQAAQQGGTEFLYRGVKFITQEGVLKWVASNGNHIPVTATPSGDCRQFTDLRQPQAQRRH